MSHTDVFFHVYMRCSDKRRKLSIGMHLLIRDIVPSSALVDLAGADRRLQIVRALTDDL